MLFKSCQYVLCFLSICSINYEERYIKISHYDIDLSISLKAIHANLTILLGVCIFIKKERPSISLVVLFCLKIYFVDTNIVVLAFFWLVFVWNVFFHYFTVSLSVFYVLNVAIEMEYGWSFTIESDYILIQALSPFLFKYGYLYIWIKSYLIWTSYLSYIWCLVLLCA